MRKFTSPNFLIESRVRVETIATIAMFYERKGETFKTLAALGRAIIEDLEQMIISSGENRITDPIEAEKEMWRLSLRGHKEKRMAGGYLSSAQLHELGRPPSYSRKEAQAEINKAAEFDEEEFLEKVTLKDQKFKDALAQGPNQSTIVKEEKK